MDHPEENFPADESVAGTCGRRACGATEDGTARGGGFGAGLVLGAGFGHGRNCLGNKRGAGLKGSGHW